jgi:hypothetical protein
MLLKERERRIEVTRRRGRRCKQLLDDGDERIVKIERGNTTLQSVENSLWKRLWICHNTHF